MERPGVPWRLTTSLISPQPSRNPYLTIRSLAQRHGVCGLLVLLRLPRDVPDAHNNLGVTLAQQGKWEAAIAAFEQVLQFPAYNTPEIVYQNLGWAYYNLERYAEAEAALTTALRLDPRLPITHYTLGLTWEKTGRVQA